MAPEKSRFTPLADAYAHPTLARLRPQYRQWPCVPRTVQVLSGVRSTGISTRFVGTSSGTRYERILPLVRNAGVGAICIAGNYGTAKEKSLLAAWPLPRWPGWIEHVNGSQTEADLAALRRFVQRGNPFGEGAWCDHIVRRLGLQRIFRRIFFASYAVADGYGFFDPKM